MEGTDHSCSGGNVEKKKNKEKGQIILRLLHLEGKTGSVRGKEADPFSLPTGNLVWGGGLEAQKRILVLGFIQLECPETSVRAIKPQ